MFINFGFRKLYLFLLTAFMLSAEECYTQTDNPVFTSAAYSIYPGRVVQGVFQAEALSSTEIHSNYKSPKNLHVSPAVDFKFSINGKDNEQVSGSDHRYICLGDSNITPLIKFGERYVDKKIITAGTYLKPGSQLIIRLDMREIFAAFSKQGYYVFYNGDKLYKSDFKAVFVAGNQAPMIWDFNNLIGRPGLELKDPDGDGIYETRLILNQDTEKGNTARSWKATRNTTAFPSYHSPYVISDALYNLSLEEMENAVEPDSTFRTGKEWSGVWTRDISYSIILSMAILQPRVAIKSLMRKVKNGKIVQDTGTGGAYPVSSDRMVWAIAAWEVYKVTGDKDWLKQAYEIIKSSAGDDTQNVYDNRTGLVRGESSFLDWREETYPRWMEPVDIYESECLGTNAVHYQMNIILGRMTRLLAGKKESETYFSRAERIRKGMDSLLWISDKGYYGQFLYGRKYKMLSTRSEALGEALTILFDIADSAKQQSIIDKTPVTDFGITCIYPQIPNVPPYHNNGIWPFVETYWAMAASKAGREKALMQSVSAIYRASALFLTNKENFVSEDGDYAGTQINSSNMLWSLSGNLALVYKVFFGIQYDENSIRFTPFVPAALSGVRSLNQFKYRNALLDIRMEGSGRRPFRGPCPGPWRSSTLAVGVGGAPASQLP